MKKTLNRVLSLLLAVVLCLGLLPVGTAQAAGDALDMGAVRTLLNAEKLHPQRTGYPELDGLLERIVAPYKDRDNYTKIKAMYDWAVTQVSYSWAGYSQNWAPAYDCFTLTYDLEYESGLPEAYPKDMIYRAYHMLTARTGVCYDWGILFAVMARYVGIESYVHTGILRIGTWTGHHGWTELRLGGVNYIFDAQQDNRLLGIYGYLPYEHFGIAPASAGRWSQETAANAARDRSLLPLTADRTPEVTVTVLASRSGTVEGAGAYTRGGMVTLTASEEASWYTTGGLLLSYGMDYTFFLEEDVKLLVLFGDDLFADVPAGAWYTEAVCSAAEQGLFVGSGFATFDPQGKMTRAMLASVLARLDGADMAAAAQAPFADVNQEAWYAGAVNWAYENRVVYGVTETRFDPMGRITREQAAAMIVRYLESRGVEAEPEEGFAFADQAKISGYAREPMAKAQALGIFTGYEDGTARPQNLITRAESASLLIRMYSCLEAA